MKKILIITISALLFNTVLFVASTQNAYAKTCTTSAQCDVGEICVKQAEKSECTSMMPQPTDDKKEIKTVKDLPRVTATEVFKTVIKTILGAAMLLTIVAIVIAAIYYIQSEGDEEDISKAKNIILYLVIGMAVMAAAYGLVTGVAQFEFFQAK